MFVVEDSAPAGMVTVMLPSAECIWPPLVPMEALEAVPFGEPTSVMMGSPSIGISLFGDGSSPSQHSSEIDINVQATIRELQNNFFMRSVFTRHDKSPFPVRSIQSCKNRRFSIQTKNHGNRGEDIGRLIGLFAMRKERRILK